MIVFARLGRAHPIKATIVPACIALGLAVVLQIANVASATALWLFVSSMVLFALSTSVVYTCAPRQKKHNAVVEPRRRAKKKDEGSDDPESGKSAAVASAEEDTKSSPGATKAADVSMSPHSGTDNTADASAAAKEEEQAVEAFTRPGGVGGTDGMYNVCFLLWIAAFALFTFVFFLSGLVDAGLRSPPEVADHVFAAIVSAALCITCCLVLYISISVVADKEEEEEGEPAEAPCGAFPGCYRCCGVFGLPLVLVLAILLVWNECTEVHQTLTLPMPGDLVAVVGGGGDGGGSDFPPTHLYCDDNGGSAESAPTVLFLHGFLGSALDAAWVRRDPAFTATGLRFCSMDRPGYGFSWPYPLADTTRHFGRLAEGGVAVLKQAGIAGEIIVMAHSLGGYWSMALAAEMENHDEFNLTAVVSIDCLTPLWERQAGSTEDMPKPDENCNTDEPEAAAGSTLYALARRILPTGAVRLLVDIGFAGYDTLMKMLPSDVEAYYKFQTTTAKYMTGVTDDDQRWVTNCGYAKRGVDAFGRLIAHEVIVVPDGVNLTRHADLTPNANVHILEGPPADPHSGVFFQEDWAPKVTQILLSAINATRPGEFV